ncbi:MAG: hypothetical protein JWN03_2529 [Nocardia sp.]|uniref:hypothetical protein n=1 Tax=Nocardia sp. TaxID=1821 RepID=UPI00263091B8|nr:hypothetical protein [Nocardia sp.]MCU1642254.1 hypothetical protein [Nocardia sp.]
MARHPYPTRTAPREQYEPEPHEEAEDHSHDWTHDRYVLTPNQRIVFFTVRLFVFINWLIALSLGGVIVHSAGSSIWKSPNAKYGGPTSIWVESFLISFVVTSIGAGFVLALIAVIKGRLRKYALEQTEY